MSTGAIVLLIIEAVFYGYVFILFALMIIDKIKKYLIRRRLQKYDYKRDKHRNNKE